MNNKYNRVIGSQAEQVVKERLWRSGYRVKDFSDLGWRNGFDLLVNDRIRIEVKFSKIRFNKNGVSWIVQGVKPEKFDVLCVVLEAPLDGYRIYYLKGKRMLKYFCNNEKESNFGIHLTEAKVSQFFTESPKNLF